MKHTDTVEIIFLLGIFILLLACIGAEVFGMAAGHADMSSIITGLMLILTSAGSHFFGKKAGLAQMEKQQ